MFENKKLINCSLLNFVACFITGALFVFILSCFKSSRKLSLFSAAGAKPAIDELCKIYEEKSGIKIEINYGGGEVLSKMEIAKSGDIYIEPEQKFMKLAKDKGIIEPETIKNVCYMIPVIAVKKGNPKNIHSLSDLAKPGIRIAIPRPETTLLAKYDIEIFQKAGSLNNAIKKNIVTYVSRPDNITILVDTGHIDAGITWHFYQTISSNQIENVFFTAEKLPGIGEMQIAVSKYSKNKSLAKQFVDFVTSSNGKAIFKKYGYIVNHSELRKYWRGYNEKLFR